MNTLVEIQSFYQPVARTFDVANETYWFIDEKIAEQRATAFLKDAKEKMRKNEGSLPTETAKITQDLLIATDFGCNEAPYIMGERILAGSAGEHYFFEDALLFYRLAAERGNKKAAHCMACCYAGLDYYPLLLRAGKRYFTEIANDERMLLATYYFEQSN